MLQAPAAIEKEWRDPQFLKTIAVLSCLSFLCLQFALSFIFTSTLIIFFSTRLFFQSLRKIQSSGIIIFLPRCLLVYLFDKSIFDVLCSIYSIPKAASQCLRNFLFSIASSQEFIGQTTENLETSKERKTDLFLNTLESSTKRIITTKGLLNIIPESISMAILPRDKVSVKEQDIPSKCQSEDDDRLSLASTNTSHSNKTRISNKIGCFLGQIAEEQVRNQQNLDGLICQDNKKLELQHDKDKYFLHEDHKKINKESSSSSNDSNCISNLEFSFNSESFDRVSADSNTFVRSASVSKVLYEQEQQKQIGDDKEEKDDLSFYQIFNNRQKSGKMNAPLTKQMKDKTQNLIIKKRQSSSSSSSSSSLSSETSKQQTQTPITISMLNKLHEFRNRIKSNCIQIPHQTQMNQNYYPNLKKQSKSVSMTQKMKKLKQIFMLFKNMKTLKKTITLTHSFGSKKIIKAFLLSSLFMGIFLSTTRIQNGRRLVLKIKSVKKQEK